jgi:hypothetical protein
VKLPRPFSSRWQSQSSMLTRFALLLAVAVLVAFLCAAGPTPWDLAPGALAQDEPTPTATSGTIPPPPTPTPTATPGTIPPPPTATPTQTQGRFVIYLPVVARYR